MFGGIVKPTFAGGSSQSLVWLEGPGKGFVYTEARPPACAMYSTPYGLQSACTTQPGAMTLVHPNPSAGGNAKIRVPTVRVPMQPLYYHGLYQPIYY
mmetsp:Transcript_24587/g.62228  ORF Transcript_24587/g.62228 Transcript_24587/m.62228 type:complete len:97 (+) Transcript_24587:44-334(+)